jgi:prepilin-type N-terminal cleavage/methylation domain-containing protein
MPKRARIDSEAGFSLPEVMITIVIVAVTFTAILGGLMTTITVSGLHRKQATADAVARDAAEWVKDSVKNPYTNCAAQNSYTIDLTSTGISAPSGFTASVTSVEYWNGATPILGSPYSLSFPWNQSQCQSAGDKGLQRITIVATSSDGQATEKVQILKRIVP